MESMLSTEKYETYLRVLREELVPAMGCTEPIAIAYASAKARSTLGAFPDSCEIFVSGNIIKNAKSVVVPHTGGMKGIEAAVIAGLVGGREDARLEVLSRITDEDVARMAEVKERLPISVSLSDSDRLFDIGVRLCKGSDTAFVRITDRHTNVVAIEKNGAIIYEGRADEGTEQQRPELSVEEIVTFADTVELSDVEPTIQRQIDFNMAIAEEGIRGDWGAGVGRVYLNAYTPDLAIKAKAYAAAGSDARMNGCELPVIINSGSGNQGLTASVPVIIYWKEMNLPKERLIRALVLSNLITLRIKHGVGTLSAYCGAVCAGAGAGCGIAYLHGGGYRDIAHTLVNALAIDSGLICDGAKASCAAKIATAVENGILGYKLFCAGKQFFGGDGIVKKGVEATIESVGRLASRGMLHTDREILSIMLDS